MKKFALIAAVFLVAFFYVVPPAAAQTFTVTSCPAAAQVANAGQTGRPIAVDIFGNTCTSGSGGGGGGDATAANQVITNTKLDTLIAGVLGPIPTQAGSVSIGGVSLLATTTGGCTPGKILSAASNNSTLIGSAGTRTLCKLVAINTSATIYYLKTYDKATAPTCGTDTPVATYPIPPSNGGVAVPLGTYGEAYALGLGICYVAGLADNDNTNAATGTAISYSFK